MGQRSQFYVRFNDENGGKHLVAARDFGWNYGSRMISRARGVVDWLEGGYIQYPQEFINQNSCEYRQKLKQIIETNFDYRDVVLSHDLIDEYMEYGGKFDEVVFRCVDNNDGQFLLDCIIDYNSKNKNRLGKYKVQMKYAFLTNDFDFDNIVMDPVQYFNWDEAGQDIDKTSERNARFITKRATLMTSNEVEEYISYNYLSSMRLTNKTFSDKELEEK